MKSLVVALFFSAIVYPALSQNRDNVNSLKKVLGQAKEDSSKVSLYEKLSAEFLFSNPDTALYFSSQGLKLARQINFKHGEFLNLTMMGTSFAVKGDYVKAVETQLQAKGLAEQMNDPKAIRTNLANLGAAYQYSGDNRKALTYYNKTEAKNLLNDKTKNLLGLIGKCYYDLNIMDSAQYFRKKGFMITTLRVTHIGVRSTTTWPRSMVTRVILRRLSICIDKVLDILNTRQMLSTDTIGWLQFLKRQELKTLRFIIQKKQSLKEQHSPMPFLKPASC